MAATRKIGSPAKTILKWLLVTLFLINVDCGHGSTPRHTDAPLVLTVGYGLTTTTDPLIGVQQAVRNIALDTLVSLGKDGRAVAGVADTWSTSNDGLTWRVRLRPSATFSDGRPADASIVRDVLAQKLPQTLGPAFEDVSTIRPISASEIEFSLHQRSAFLLEGLEVPIEEPGSRLVGTGPFYVSRQETNEVEMRANQNYYRGRPILDRIIVRPYRSIRAAWADMLRGQVDMLYEVGLDALDSLQPSTEVKVFTFQRHYAYIVLLNLRRPFLRDSSVRHALNAAIDRQMLVSNALKGHGRPADGPVWPDHWAYDSQLSRFRYEPRSLTALRRVHLTCLIPDASLERLALEVQRQLQAIGLDFELEAVAGDKFLARLNAGDFDAVLTDAVSAPTLLRPYLFWHSGSPFNWGAFSSKSVDAALDSIRHAPDDQAYKAGVAAFQRAIVDDPPAIFLAWSERARAVRRRFSIPVEPGADIWGRTLAEWRPLAEERTASRN